MVHRPRPVALALVHFVEHATDQERRVARVTLALRANDEGYALAEMFEIDPRRLRQDAVLDAFEELSERLDASHVIVVGHVDPERVERVAEHVRMTVERLPYHAASCAAAVHTRSKLST